MIEKLPIDDRHALLAPLITNGWVLHSERDALVKEFKFKNFSIIKCFWITPHLTIKCIGNSIIPCQTI